MIKTLEWLYTESLKTKTSEEYRAILAILLGASGSKKTISFLSKEHPWIASAIGIGIMGFGFSTLASVSAGKFLINTVLKKQQENRIKMLVDYTSKYGTRALLVYASLLKEKIV